MKAEELAVVTKPIDSLFKSATVKADNTEVEARGAASPGTRGCAHLIMHRRPLDSSFGEALSTTGLLQVG